jgi:dienelactone hydrolase
VGIDETPKNADGKTPGVAAEKHTPSRFLPRARRILARLVVAVLAVAALLWLAVTAGWIGIYLPEPAGPHRVGRAHYDLIDRSRPETFGGDPNACRQIVITVYYPAMTSPGAKAGPYVEEKMARFLAGKLHMPAATATLIHSHAYSNLPIAAAKFPVVLFFPGIGTAPVEYTSAVEDLASRGYVVALVYPSYSVAVTVFANGQVAPLSDAGFRCENEPPNTSDEQKEADRGAIGSVWVADARFVLDELGRMEVNDPRLAGHLDLDRVGIAGHSFGGATAAEAIRVDRRFKAAINMDGTPFRITGTSTIDRPVLWMTSDYAAVTDDQLARIHMSRDEFDAKLRQRQEQRRPFGRLLKRGHLWTLKGSTHSTFISDDALIGAVIPGMSDPLANIDGRRAAAIIGKYIALFFDQHLNKQVEKRPDVDWPADPAVEISALGEPR